MVQIEKVKYNLQKTQLSNIKELKKLFVINDEMTLSDLKNKEFYKPIDKMEDLYLKNLPNLKTVEIEKYLNLIIMGKMDSLSYLSLKNVGTVLISINNLLKLESLELINIKKIGFDIKRPLVALQNIIVRNCNFNNNKLSWCTGIPFLRHFQINNCNLVSLKIDFHVNNVVRFLVNNNNLESLHIKEPFSNIEEINLTGNSLTKPFFIINKSNKTDKITIRIDQGTQLPTSIRKLVMLKRIVVIDSYNKIVSDVEYF